MCGREGWKVRMHGTLSSVLVWVVGAMGCKSKCLSNDRALVIPFCMILTGYPRFKRFVMRVVQDDSKCCVSDEILFILRAWEYGMALLCLGWQLS